MFLIRQIFESLRFAANALKANLLRTILSLLGVTVGIFAIISVLTIVDSLEKNVKASLNFLGTDVLYVDKFPWGGGDGSRDWWKSYIKWPTSSYPEYRFLKTNLQYASAVCIYANVGGGVVKRNSNSLGQVNFVGGSDDYDQVFDVKVAEGRYFSELELASGRDVVIIGYEIKQKLFANNENPIGKTIRIKNRKYTVIGTTEREGENVFGDSFGDYSCLMPYNALRKIYQTGTGRWNEFNARSVIGLRGTETDIGLGSLENELRGLMRGRRGLKPTEKDNFAINRPEAIAKMISGVFDVLSLAGWVIGGFSILVGGFGIANIMFVSVKERTSIIGLQKSLGAKNYFILFQFLFESIFLSLIGGLTGLLLVWLISNISIGNLEIVLSAKNVVLGLGVSTVIGIVSGLVPATMASRLDPVEAIRSN
jgi:putative ABC transport system permease protein